MDGVLYYIAILDNAAGGDAPESKPNVAEAMCSWAPRIFKDHVFDSNRSQGKHCIKETPENRDLNKS